MNNEHEKEFDVQGQIVKLLDMLVANRPGDRSELDKIYAVAITDTQRLYAWWWFSTAGLPPYPADTEE